MTWTATQCAAEWGIAESTWRAAVADGRAPAPLGYDPVTGLRIWDAAQVRDYPRPGRGARTDLPSWPATVGELAALLIDLADLYGPTIPRGRIRREWLTVYPEDGSTAPMSPAAVARRATRQGERGDGKPTTAGTRARKRISGGLAVLEREGAITRVGTTTVAVLDHARLAEIASEAP